MAYATTPFGNGVLVGSGGNVVRNVDNFYGARAVLDGADGVYLTDGNQIEFSLSFSGADINATKTQLITNILPAGAKITRVLAKVKEVFVTGGTTPTILVGTSGSEVTNGVSLSAAQAQALGTYDLTLNGTWAAVLAAATTLNVALGGTTPTVTAVGRVEFVILYTYIS